MKQNPNSSARHLRSIPHNTVVHTPAERDKCIEDIKAIIEKYSKK